MESKIPNFVDETILNTPKPTATSTAQKKKPRKRLSENIEPVNLLSINGLTRISENTNENISYQLQEQRNRAENTLQRANNVSGIPSCYLRANSSIPRVINLSSDSTISESDLLRTPTDSSTPKSSVGRASLSESIAQLSHKLKNPNISIDNFMEEFQKAMNIGSNVSTESLKFTPAEEAAGILLADEMSWRRQHEIPVNEAEFSVGKLSGKSSIGEFFRQRSDTLSIFEATSPIKKHIPVPLVELPTTEEEFVKHKSLSISTIQKCLESEDTPRRAANILLNHCNETDSSHSLETKMEKISPSVCNNLSNETSENELLRCIYDKENVDTLNMNDKKRNSSPGSVGSPVSRSSSRALTSLPDGKLPIESTASELIWGSVKVDKCESQEFSIRNKSSKRLGIQISVTGLDYKLRKDSRSDSDLLSSVKIILHPYESKAVMVCFIPTKIGE